MGPRQRVGRAAMCTTVSDPASQPRSAPVPPCVLWHQTPPSCWGGLRRCYVSHGSRPTNLVGRASTLPCVTRLWTLPPCWGGLRRCHMSHSSRPTFLSRRASTLPRVPLLQTRLPAGEGSGVATCPMTLWGSRASSIKEVNTGSVVHLRLARYQGTHARKFPRRTRLIVLQWLVRGTHAWHMLQRPVRSA
jgi:hypothetical protein